MSDTRTCPMCDKAITPKQRTFCSSDCRVAFFKNDTECANCGKPLDKPRQNKFCSMPCANEYHGKQRDTRHEVECLNCGKKWTPRTMWRSTFCGNECSNEYRKKNGNDDLWQRVEKTCAICGRTFSTVRTNKKICSDACHLRKWEEGRINQRACRICGKVFMPRSEDHWVCNRDGCNEEKAKRDYTKNVRIRRARVINARPIIVVKCIECGKAFAPMRRLPLLYCSKQCMNKAGKRNRRHRMRSAARSGERVDRAYISERDGWTCHICGEPIDRRAIAPHPKSATMDHVVPLALGGTHTRDNVQLAHFLCNSIKGARHYGQGLLLG